MHQLRPYSGRIRTPELIRDIAEAGHDPRTVDLVERSAATHAMLTDANVKTLVGRSGKLRRRRPTETITDLVDDDLDGVSDALDHAAAVWSLTRFPGRFLCVDHAAASAAV